MLTQRADDVGLWQRELPGFEQEVSNYERIALVTTCRTSYRDAIWSGDDGSRFDYTKGFEEDNVEEAIIRYFAYYKITADLTQAPLNQFRDPLYLRLFCLAENPTREAHRQVYLGQRTLFQVFDSFLDYTDAQVRRRLGQPPQARPTTGSLPRLAQFLWEHRVRQIPAREVYELFDGKPPEQVSQESSLTWALLDEDLLINRDWTGTEETIGFTYDLLAGYLIAKNMLSGTDAQSARSLVSSELFIQRLLSDDYSELHPLHEDILRCVCALFPEFTGVHGYEISDNDRFFSYSIAALFEMTPQSIGVPQRDLVRDRFQKPQSRPGLLQLASTTFINADHPLNIDFWDSLLRDLPMPDRDVSWTEYVRSHASHFLKEISRFEAACHADALFEAVAAERMRLAARLFSWLLPSTHRLLRDTASRALYWYGRLHPDDLFAFTLEGLDINDPYVPERLIAASYGVAMALHRDPVHKSFADEILPRYAHRLYESMFSAGASHSTTHALTRDFARHTIEIALLHQPDLLRPEEVELVRPPFTQGGIREWGMSEDRNDGDYRDGNAPLQMDFLNYTLGYLTPGRANYYSEDIGYKEVVGNIYWRVYQLGYSLKAFGDIDKEIVRYEPLGGSDDNARRVDRYGKKYSWIAYYELYGYREDRGLLKWDYGDEFGRPSSVDIDPSFPDLPHPEKVATFDFLGDRDSTLREWIQEVCMPDVAPYLVSQMVDGEQGPWVALHGYFSQDDEQATREVFAHIRSLLVNDRDLQDLAELLSEDPPQSLLHSLPEDYYTFAGEIPWCETLPANGLTELVFTEAVVPSEQPAADLNGEGTSPEATGIERRESDDGNIEFIVRLSERHLPEPVIKGRQDVLIPVREIHWEGYHSGANPGQVVAVPARELPETLGLWIKLPTWDMYDSDRRRASVQIDWQQNGNWRSRQSLSFLRRDLLDQYLQIQGMSLIWVIWGERRVRYQSDTPFPPPGVDYQPYSPFRTILVYQDGKIAGV